MSEVIIIAGPNGAGKTTFAGEFLPNEAGCPEFVNADLIAAGLSPFQPEKAAFSAGRIMLERIGELASGGKSFALETTLATRTYLRLIPQWQKAGYIVKLCFLKLPDAEFAIKRVERRVHHGGHNIPIDTIQRRYARGWKNLENGYLDLVDEWAIYDASQSPPLLIDSGDNHHSPQTVMEDNTPYRTTGAKPKPKRPPGDSDFLAGVEAALKRASEKAIAKDLAAGLEPIVAKPGMNG